MHVAPVSARPRVSSGRGGQVQVGEQHLARRQPLVLPVERLLHLEHHLRVAPRPCRRRRSTRPAARYSSSLIALPSPAPVSIRTSCPRRTSSMTPAVVSATRVLVRLDLLRDADPHAGPIVVVWRRDSTGRRVDPAVRAPRRSPSSREHRLQVGRRDVLGAVWISAMPLQRFTHVHAAGVPDVRVGAAAGLDVGHRLAAAAPRARAPPAARRGRSGRTGSRRTPARCALSSSHSARLAANVAASSIACTCSRRRPGSRLRASASTQALRRDDVAGDRRPSSIPTFAVVLGVDPPQRHVGDRSRRGHDRASPLLGGDAGMGRPAGEAELAPCAGSALRGRCSRSGRRGRSSSPTRALRRAVSNALAPRRPTSSIGVSTSSTPACGTPAADELRRRPPASPPPPPCCRPRGSCRGG